MGIASQPAALAGRLAGSLARATAQAAGEDEFCLKTAALPVAQPEKKRISTTMQQITRWAEREGEIIRLIPIIHY